MKTSSSAKIKGSVLSGRKSKDLKKTEYVLPLGGTGWVVKNAAASKFTVITDNRKEAICIAVDIAKRKNHEVIVHDKSGKIVLHKIF